MYATSYRFCLLVGMIKDKRRDRRGEKSHGDDAGGWLARSRSAETINGTTYERMLVKLDRLPQDQASPYRQPSQGGAMLLGPF